MLAVGAIVLVGATYMGTGDRMNLPRSMPRGYDQFGKLPDRRYEEQASPGTGIYTVGAGGLLIAFGGTLLAGLSLGGVTAAPMRRTKTCPDCADPISSVFAPTGMNGTQDSQSFASLNSPFTFPQTLTIAGAEFRLMAALKSV